MSLLRCTLVSIKIYFVHGFRHIVQRRGKILYDFVPFLHYIRIPISNILTFFVYTVNKGSRYAKTAKK